MRCADSLGLRTFLGFRLTEDTPAHASMTIIRQRLPEAVFDQVFIFGLRLLERKGLLRGKTVAVDATTLEANAAMKSIVGKDTGEDWKEYLRGLAKAEGIENPTEEDLRRLDRGRKDKKVSNEQWESPTDRDSRIAKMKDGRTPLAYKADAQTTERRRRGLGRPFGRFGGADPGSDYSLQDHNSARHLVLGYCWVATDNRRDGPCHRFREPVRKNWLF